MVTTSIAVACNIRRKDSRAETDRRASSNHILGIRRLFCPERLSPRPLVGLSERAATRLSNRLAGRSGPPPATNPQETDLCAASVTPYSPDVRTRPALIRMCRS